MDFIYWEFPAGNWMTQRRDLPIGKMILGWMRFDPSEGEPASTLLTGVMKRSCMKYFQRWVRKSILGQLLTLLSAPFGEFNWNSSDIRHVVERILVKEGRMKSCQEFFRLFACTWMTREGHCNWGLSGEEIISDQWESGGYELPFDWRPHSKKMFQGSEWRLVIKKPIRASIEEQQ